MSDKFFRLNIDKLLTKLPVPVTFNESQQAMINGLNENRFLFILPHEELANRMQLLF